MQQTGDTATSINHGLCVNATHPFFCLPHVLTGMSSDQGNVARTFLYNHYRYARWAKVSYITHVRVWPSSKGFRGGKERIGLDDALPQCSLFPTRPNKYIFSSCLLEITRVSSVVVNDHQKETQEAGSVPDATTQNEGIHEPAIER